MYLLCPGAIINLSNSKEGEKLIAIKFFLTLAWLEACTFVDALQYAKWESAAPFVLQQ